MKVGELFVGLGIKGSEKTIGAISGITKGLGEAKTMSLETKAGILGMMYALEQLTARSNKAGTDLKNFTLQTGLSAKTLQQWEYAGALAGASADEVANSLKTVQDKMTDMVKFGKNAPESMGVVYRTLGGFDYKKAADTRGGAGMIYTMNQLQKFAQIAKASPDIVRKALKDFGLSENVISGMLREVFNQKNFAAAPIYSDKEINKLDKTRAAWTNLGQKIEMAIGHLNAKHGLQLVKDIDKITTAVLKLADSLIRVAEKFKVFDAAEEMFKGLNAILELMNGKSVEDVSKDMSKNKKRQFGQGTWWMNAIDSVQDAMLAPNTGPSAAARGKFATPGPQNSAPATVTQHLHFQHPGTDHKKTADSTHHAIKKAWKQTPQGQEP